MSLRTFSHFIPRKWSLYVRNWVKGNNCWKTKVTDTVLVHQNIVTLLFAWIEDNSTIQPGQWALSVSQHRLNYTKVLDSSDGGGTSNPSNPELNQGGGGVFDNSRSSDTQPPSGRGDLKAELKNMLIQE